MLMRAVIGGERDWPELALFFAVPNGGHRSKRVAGQMKAEGVRRGVPDYLFPVPRGGFNGLAIELKTSKGQPSAEQRAWLEALRSHGWHAVLCRGWEQAWGVVRDYLAADGAANDDEGGV
jgi:hypothetical protein